MNNERRKRLNQLQDRLEALKDKLSEIPELHGELESIFSDLSDLKDEEQEYYDNVPDSLKGGALAEASQESINEMEAAYGELETLVEVFGEDYSAKIDEIFENLDNAKGT